jgi:Transposase DDE domain
MGKGFCQYPVKDSLATACSSNTRTVAKKHVPTKESVMILASSLPRFKEFLGKVTPSPCALLFIAVFVLHQGRRSVARAARMIRSDIRDAGNLLRFLAGSREPALLLQAAQASLWEAVAQEKGLWLFAVDGTQHGQQGQQTENTFSRGNTQQRPKKGNRKHKQQHRRSCHTFVMGLLLSPSGVRVPFWLPYYTREYCQQHRQPYHTQAELAARLIRELPLPRSARLVVVGDTAFDADSIRAACGQRGCWWVTPVNPERVMAGPKPRPKVLSLDNDLSVSSFSPVTLRFDRGPHAAQRRQSLSRALNKKQERTYWVHNRIAEVHNVGSVQLLFSTSKAPKGPGAIKAQKVLMTNAVDASIEQVLTWYNLRWQVELLFKELKSGLGLTQYKFQRFCKVERWVTLCLVAFAYLEWYRLLGLRETQGKLKAYWQRARTHGIRQVLQRQVEDEDLRQIYEWAHDPKSIHRLRQILHAAYDARSIPEDETMNH